MQTFEPGEDIELVVPFLVEGEPVIPAVGSVTWTLRDNAGAKVTGYIDKAETTTNLSTEVALTIDAADTTIDPDARFEKRTVQIKATVGGRAYTDQITFRIAEFVNMTAKPDDVRAFIGVGPSELPDRDIDLFSAFIDSEEAVDAVGASGDFLTALAAGTRVELQANRMIMLRSVLAVLPSLGQRILQRHTDGSIGTTRHKLDLTAIAAQARGELASAMDLVTGRATSAVPLLIFGLDTDVITGQ